MSYFYCYSLKICKICIKWRRTPRGFKQVGINEAFLVLHGNGKTDYCIYLIDEKIDMILPTPSSPVTT